MRGLRTAALVAIAVAALALPPSAGAALEPTILSLSQPNGNVGVEWTFAGGTFSWWVETSLTTTDTNPADGFWDAGQLTRVDFSATHANLTGLAIGFRWVRVITTATQNECASNPPAAGCVYLFSNPESIQPSARIHGLPALTGVSGADGVLSATWTVPSQGSSFEVQVAKSPVRRANYSFRDPVLSARVPANATSFTFPANALPPGNYYVQVVTTQELATCDADRDSRDCPLDFTPPAPVTVTASVLGGGPPGAAGTASDKVVALGAISAASRQDVDKLGITLNPGEAVQAKLSGSVNVPGASKVYRFKTVNKSLGAGKKTRLSLKLASKAKKAVKRALRRKKKLKAKLTLLVTDAAGNAQTKKYTVRLKR